MVDNHIDVPTQEKPRQHGISTIQDINNLSHPDMIEIGLNVGERNRIKKATETVPEKDWVLNDDIDSDDVLYVLAVHIDIDSIKIWQCTYKISLLYIFYNVF